MSYGANTKYYSHFLNNTYPAFLHCEARGITECKSCDQTSFLVRSAAQHSNHLIM